MSTLGEVVKELNERTCHPNNFHVAMINMDLLPEPTSEEDNTMHDLLKQTYDFRFDKPGDDVFHVDLTADNMRYIGRALEVYNEIIFNLHMKPLLKEIITKMGES